VVAGCLVALALTSACGRGTNGSKATTSTTGVPVVHGPSGGPVPSGFLATSVSFLSNADGWMLGTAPCSAPPCTSLVRTTDGGASWVGIPAPSVLLGEPQTPSSPYATGLVFATSLDGFVYGAGLWLTADGGADWRLLPSVAGIAPYFVQDPVVAGGHLYAFVSGLSQGSTDANWRLVVGNDDGTDFHVVYRFASTTDPTDMVATGKNVYVDDGVGVMEVVGSSVTTSNPTPASNCDTLAASGAGDVLLECNMSGLGGGICCGRRLYGSTDAGSHWVRLPDPGEGAGYVTSGLSDPGGGHAAIATSSGGGAGVLVTTDYAKSWTMSFGVTNGGGATWSGLRFTDPDHGVVVFAPKFDCSECSPGPSGVGVLYQTSDGGLHWTPVTFGPNPPQPGTELAEVAPVDAREQPVPGLTVSQTGDGTCEGGSDSVTGAPDYRCFSGNFVYDPCWAVASSTTPTKSVLCMTDPWDSSVVKIVTTTPLTETGPAKPDYSIPWAVRLTSGQQCLGAQGAHSQYAGQPVDFYCTGSNMVLLGGIDQSAPTWTMKSLLSNGAGGFSTESTVQVSLAWYGGP